MALIGHWKFGALTAADTTLASVNGVGPTAFIETSTDDTLGNRRGPSGLYGADGAILLDENRPHWEIPTANALADGSRQQWSVGTWVYTINATDQPNSKSSYTLYMERHGDVGRFLFGIDRTGSMWVGGRPTAGAAWHDFYSLAHADLLPGRWVHILICVDTQQAATADRMKVYINGVVRGSVYTNPPTTFDSVTMQTVHLCGSSLYADAGAYALHEVKQWDHMLSAAEALAEYNSKGVAAHKNELCRLVFNSPSRSSQVQDYGNAGLSLFGEYEASTYSSHDSRPGPGGTLISSGNWPGLSGTDRKLICKALNDRFVDVVRLPHYSMSVWFRQTWRHATNVSYVVTHHRYNLSTQLERMFYISSNGVMNYQHYRTTGQMQVAWAPTVTLDDWHHVVIVHRNNGANGTDVDLFYDGVKLTRSVITDASGSLYDSAGWFVVGNRKDGLREFRGDIAEVRIFDKELLQSDVDTIRADVLGSLPDLRTHLRMEETSGYIVNDEVAGNTYTLKRNQEIVGVGTNNGPGGSLVSAGQVLNGTDYYELPHPNINDSPYTIAAWGKLEPALTGGVSPFLFDHRDDSLDGVLLLRSNLNTAPRLDHNEAQFPHNADVADNEWHSWIATYDGATTAKLFIDGNLAASGSVVGPINVNTPPTLGRRNYSTISPQFWDGAIADVRIYGSDKSGTVGDLLDDARPTLTMTLSGTAEVGQTLTLTPLTNDPTATIAYKWYRADNDAGLNEVQISGALSSTYVPQPADATKRIRGSGVATNVGGAGLASDETFSAYSAAVAVGPKFRYKFKDTSGTTIKAEVGGDGTSVRDASLMALGAGNGPGGELVDCGFHFDGANLDAVEIPNLGITGDYQVSFWVRGSMTTPGVAGVLYDWRDADSDGIAAFRSGLSDELGIKHNNIYDATGLSSNVLQDGLWHHVVFRYTDSANKVEYFEDGVWVKQTLNATTNPAVAALCQIGRSWSLASHMTGDIADFRVYNAASATGAIMDAARPVSSIPYVKGRYSNRARLNVQLSATATCNDHTATADWRWYTYASEANALSHTSPTEVSATSTFTPTGTHEALWLAASVAHTNVGGAGLVGVRKFSAPIRVESLPIAHWKLADTSGTTVVATVGSNGTKAGGDIVPVGTNQGPGGELVSAGFEYDGVDDNVAVGTIKSGATNFQALTTSTFSCWFKRVNGTANAAFTGIYEGFTSVDDAWVLTNRDGSSGPGRIGWRVRRGLSTNLFDMDSPSDLGYGDNEWHHIAATLPSRKIFVDGVDITSSFTTLGSTPNALANDDHNWYLGAQNSNPNPTLTSFFAGSLADFRFYDSDESANIVALMDAARPTCVPTISGLAQIGQTLTCSISSNDATATFEYQWYKAEDAFGNGETLITGATTATYVPLVSDEGAVLRCRGRSTNTGGAGLQSDYVYSDWTAAVTPSGSGHSLTANSLSSGIPALDSPALTQEHILTASALTSGTPVLDSPAVSQDGQLTANPLSAGTPTLASPALNQTHVLTASPLSTGSPTLTSPALNQVHVLTAPTAISSGAPTLASPSLNQTHVLTANPLSSGVPELASPVLGQPGQLAANPLSTGSPTLGTPSLSQVHVFTASALSGGAPSLDAPTLTQEHAFDAEALSAGAPTLSSPTLGGESGFVATGLSTGAPTLGSPSLSTGQMVATALSAGSPTLDSPSISQVHVFTATALTAGTPYFTIVFMNPDDFATPRSRASTAIPYSRDATAVNAGSRLTKITRDGRLLDVSPPQVREL